MKLSDGEPVQVARPSSRIIEPARDAAIVSHQRRPGVWIKRWNPRKHMLIGMLVRKVDPTRTVKTPDIAAPSKIDDVRLGRMDGQVLTVPGVLHVSGSHDGLLRPCGSRCPGIVSPVDSNQPSVPPYGADTDVDAVRNVRRD